MKAEDGIENIFLENHKDFFRSRKVIWLPGSMVFLLSQEMVSKNFSAI